MPSTNVILAASNFGPTELLTVLVVIGIPTLVVVRLRRRLNSRPCPRCGERVANGALDCPQCQFDFRTVG